MSWVRYLTLGRTLADFEVILVPFEPERLGRDEGERRVSTLAGPVGALPFALPPVAGESGDLVIRSIQAQCREISLQLPRVVASLPVALRLAGKPARQRQITPNRSASVTPESRPASKGGYRLTRWSVLIANQQLLEFRRQRAPVAPHFDRTSIAFTLDSRSRAN